MVTETAQKTELCWIYQNTMACFLVVFVFSSACYIIAGKPEVVSEKCITTVTNWTVKKLPCENTDICFQGGNASSYL